MPEGISQIEPWSIHKYFTSLPAPSWESLHITQMPCHWSQHIIATQCSSSRLQWTWSSHTIDHKYETGTTHLPLKLASLNKLRHKDNAVGAVKWQCIGLVNLEPVWLLLLNGWLYLLKKFQMISHELQRGDFCWVLRLKFMHWPSIWEKAANYGGDMLMVVLLTMFSCEHGNFA